VVLPEGQPAPLIDRRRGVAFGAPLSFLSVRPWRLLGKSIYVEDIKTSDKLRALDMLIRLGGFYAPKGRLWPGRREVGATYLAL
jgi:hypothetical protein